MDKQDDKIVIYQTPDGNTSIDVKFDGDTVWLTQHEMSLLIDVAENNITYLMEGSRQVRRTIDYYNLGMIISIGYRVNNINATQFRIWATKILKDYLIKSYAVNNRLRAENYTQLRQLVQILGRTVSSQDALTTDEARAIVDVVSDYTYALDTLDRYDYQQLGIKQATFMETLISAIQKLVIKDVVLYADRKIAATKEVINK